MKNLFYLSFIALFLFSCSGPVKPAKVEGEMSFYGSEIPVENAVSINDLLARMNTSDTLTDVIVSGEIVETCAVKGCWMTINNSNGEDMRVKFKDYGFFVPTEGAGGKQTVFKGTAYKDMITVDMQRHYIDDSDLEESEKETQKAAITEPKAVVSFEAIGVAIKGMESTTSAE